MKNNNIAIQIKRFRSTIVLLCVAVTTAIGYLAWQRYQAAEEAKAVLAQNQDRLTKLEKEIEEVKAAIERFKKEQEEFSKMLFAERDVPAFLDGISDFAKKSEVFVIDMKTQRFTEVEVPNTSAAARSNRVRITEDLDEQKRDPQAELNQIITLAAMPIRIKIQGPFQAIGNFLTYLENYKQLLTVSDVAINADYMTYPRLDCEFTLRIYSLKKLNEIEK